MVDGGTCFWKKEVNEEMERLVSVREDPHAGCISSDGSEYGGDG